MEKLLRDLVQELSQSILEKKLREFYSPCLDINNASSLGLPS